MDTTALDTNVPNAAARASGDLTSWPQDAQGVWGKGPVRITHALEATGLFTDDALAELIKRYPEDQLSLIKMDEWQGKRAWKTGRWRDVAPADLISHLAGHSLWLNMRGVDTVDARYRDLFMTMLDELGEAIPGLGPTPCKMGILISGPGTKVAYHADLPGQALMQIRGEKTFYLYPARPPYVDMRNLQDIAYDGVEKIAYRPEFEAEVDPILLKPGQGLHWPHNGPHRVENGSMLNVSVTIEYFTTEIKRVGQMNLANAILRRRFGVESDARPTRGFGYHARRALQTGFAKAGLVQHAARVVPAFEMVKRPDGSLASRDFDDERASG